MICYTNDMEGFNPRPRAGGDPGSEWIMRAMHVSIHAPVRGATTIKGDAKGVQIVSIHAPVRGAT